MSVCGSRISSADKAKKYRTLRRLYGDVCWCCGEAIDFALPPEHPEARTLDHVVPRYLGGTNENVNLRLAHRICNETRGKWQQADAEWLAA